MVKPTPLSAIGLAIKTPQGTIILLSVTGLAATTPQQTATHSSGIWLATPTPPIVAIPFLDINLTTPISGYYNIFIGWGAGYYNSSGAQNNFIGFRSGGSNTTGSGNTFLGYWTGYNNTTGSDNTFLGYNAGTSNTTGAGNVFLGHDAGYNETGSNKLYIDNSDTTTSLIYGEFDNHSVRINGAGIGVPGYPAYTLDVSNLGVTRLALHFSLNGTDTGGCILSVADNNFGSPRG